jgi:hypothetical protein
MTSQPDMDIAEPLDPAADLAVRQGRMLKAMGEVGLGLLYELQGRCQAPVDERPDPVAIATAYDRITRAMRLTFALEARLIEAPPQAPQRSVTAPPARRPVSRAEGRRDVLLNVVPDMIKAHADAEPGFDRAEAFAESERLIDREIGEAHLLNRPILELVALICRDLGVEPDWDLWDPEAWTDPRWGLTEAELSDAAHPYGPRERRPDAWPPPGSIMPLPDPAPAPS